jgi:hypothetical protein
MVYVSFRAAILEPSGRTFFPVASQMRGQDAVAVNVDDPLRTDASRAAGRMQAFFGEYHFHATFVDFLLDPNGANVQEYFTVLPATLYELAIFILIRPA